MNQVNKALADALELLGAEETKGTDVATARRLLQKADEAKSINNTTSALEFAKASRHSAEISSRKARLLVRLSESQVKVSEAKAGGVETLSLEKSLTDAAKAIESGDFGRAESLLRRTGAKKQHAQLRRRAQTVVESTKKFVAYCRERGADAEEALGELEKAEEAFRVEDFAELRERCLKAREKADQARRYARAEAFLRTSVEEASEATKQGADVSVARRLLQDAREALKNGVYADVQRLSREARLAVKDAKRYAAAESVLKLVEKDVRKEERRKSDVSAMQPLLEEAKKALGEGEFKRVHMLTKEIRGIVNEASALRRMAGALESLKLEVEDLRAIGADSSELETLIGEGEASFRARKPDEVQKVIVRGRKAAEFAREARQRAAVTSAVEKIVAKVGMGRLDAAKVKELLRQVEDAALLGQAINIDKMVEEELQIPNQERLRRAIVRLEGIKDLLLELRRTDIDIAGADELIAKARHQLEQGRFDDAEILIGQLEELTQSLKASLEASARDLLEKSKKAVEDTESKGITAPAARRFLESAEESFKQGKIYEALEFARLAHLQAEKALERKGEKLEAEQIEAQKIAIERTKEIQNRLWEIQEKLGELTKSNVDVLKVREGITNVLGALDAGQLDEAEMRLKGTEKLANILWSELKASSERTLLKAKEAALAAQNEGVPIPPLDEMLSKGEQALNEGRLSEALLVASSIDHVVAAARAAQEKERDKHTLEMGKAVSRRYARAKLLVNELKQANIDIADADVTLMKAETALRERRYDDVESILQDLEKTAGELKAQLVVAAKSIIERAERRLATASARNIDTGESAKILETSKEQLSKGSIDKAIEYGSIAEKRADEAIKAWEERQESMRAQEHELARGAIANIKRMISDLSRADIDIMGSSDAVEKAEKAFGEGRLADVATELTEVQSLAQTLQEGLRQAALDLLARSKAGLTDAKKSDLDVGRGEKVLANAEDALRDERYVEAIEYSKVINDIVETARQHKGIRALEQELISLRAEVDRAKALGMDVAASSEMLRQAQEDLTHGRYDNLNETAQRISEIVSSAQKVYVNARMEAMTEAIRDCKEMGLETSVAESIYKKAQDAVDKRDLAALDNFAKQVDVLLNSTRRAAEAERIERDVRSFEDMLAQASRVGVEVSDLRPIALEAREALAARDFMRAESLITEGKSAIRDRRRKQFADRYETKMQNIMTMIGSAKQLGANVAEAERILMEASKALEKQDLNMADILVKQAEVSAGIQIQNFIKNRYPNLIVKLSEEGLQSDSWNNYIVEIANKGKLNARNVQLKVDGDLEVKGLEQISELAVNETKKLEFGIRPKSFGQVPLNVEILYQRYFDENKYELKDLKTLRVERPGTYLVEDVFLVHIDGRLISHKSRKFRETIDEDIFGGMLTVVQDFVKDSFRQRTKVGLKRLEFGESKILLERSEHVYVACVIVGSEPELLSLYMAEVLREIEERYGPALESWTGMMQELEGVDDYVAKLIFVTDESGAALGALETSPITESVRMLNSASLLDEDADELRRILDEAKGQVAMDAQTALRGISRAKDQALRAAERFRERMKDLRDSTHRYVEEMRELGVDVGQIELLMKEADDAYDIGKYEKLQDIHSRMRDGLEKAKDAQLAKRIETDLKNLIEDIQTAKSEGADTVMAESFLSRIQDALEEKNYRLVDDYFRRAKDALEEGRKGSLLRRCRDTMDRLTSMVVDAKELGVGVEEAEGLLLRATDALQQEKTQELEAMLEAAKSSITQRIQDHLRERYPRLFLSTPTGGLQAGLWNRYVLTVANRGNWPARNIEFRVFGNVDVSGQRAIPIIRPNDKKSLDIGIRPANSGIVPIDLQVFYQRPLDESKYELTESKETKVEPPGTYPVEEVILIHTDGRLIAYESRMFREQINEERFSRLLTAVQTFIRDCFVDKGEVGLGRMGFEASNVLALQAPNVYLATTVSGEEPRLLPVYIVELLREVEDMYGHVLAGWGGDTAQLEGVQGLLRSLFYVTERQGADLGPLTSNIVTMAAKAVAKGGLKGKGELDALETVRSAIENEGYQSATRLMEQIRDAVERPAAELTAEVKAAVLATKESIGLDLSDEEVATYVDVLRQVLQAILRAKQKAGIESYWPVKRVAVKPSTQLAIDAVTSFRKIIVNQSLAKELDIIPPGETWRGMRVRAQVDTEALNRAYKLWAKKIEILLKSQDAWKIKSGLEKGEYAVGIDGQKVKIDRDMVWFEESLPETVVEDTCETGTVYVDTEMTEDILSEGYAKEIVRIIRDVRKEMKLIDEQGIQLQIKATKGLYKMLRNWREYISSQTNSTDLRFVEHQPSEGYIVEATLGEENFSLAVRSAEA